MEGRAFLTFPTWPLIYPSKPERQGVPLLFRCHRYWDFSLVSSRMVSAAIQRADFVSPIANLPGCRQGQTVELLIPFADLPQCPVDGFFYEIPFIIGLADDDGKKGCKGFVPGVLYHGRPGRLRERTPPFLTNVSECPLQAAAFS